MISPTVHPGTLTNQTTGALLSRRALRAEGWFSRLRGWIGQPPDTRVAIGITRCDAVHTFLVRFPLDLIYCDRDGHVLRVLVLPPGRVGPRVAGAETVWETVAGERAPDVSVGDTVVWTSEEAASAGEKPPEE